MASRGYVYRSGVPEDPRVRDHREKLVNAWPGNGHGFRSANCVGQHLPAAVSRGVQVLLVDPAH